MIITNSIIAPFSDRLMMYHKSLFGSSTIGIYGTAIGTSLWIDLGAHYTRLVAKMAQYMEDGFNIMIIYQWAEQPPMGRRKKPSKWINTLNKFIPTWTKRILCAE